ncbi:hypothetical protein BGZ61DRAFT_447230 [Ilyonectria robusta]|uniref:uncharacterized protein n=1 Tax=Ilyonectria robusta TaxID=1079257 RepID=UPI001E8E051E|nr:uncharacterized protein BGZ61DRAFT_447230 [Ilyonectria robusta]KAH8729984.1 hypothetical protein BGZ61DRAFT_447230 [Ilyonectria robusta]
MSFFFYDADVGWTMSSKIWVYWAFAIPVTLATSGFWYCWQQVMARVGRDGVLQG